MRKLLQLHSYKKKEFEEVQIPRKTHDILKIPNDKVDVEVLAKKHISERLENDEMNKLAFYEIVPDRFDMSPQSKKNPYKSIHNPNESYLIALNKFYEKKKYNYLERKLREELMTKTGNKLLLCEMFKIYSFFFKSPFIFPRYDQLNENNESVVQKKKKIEENLSHFNYYKPETEFEMVNRLERWQTKSQKNKESVLRGSINKSSSQEKIIRNESLKNSLSLEKISLSKENRTDQMPNEISLPKLSQIPKNQQQNHRFSIESPYKFGNNIRFPDINQGKKREKELLNEENFAVDENNLLESLKTKVEEILTMNFDIDSFSKKGTFYAKVVDNILGKMNKRINSIDSILFKKNKHLVLFRKETSIISEKIQSIKSLVFLYFFMPFIIFSI